MAGRLLRVALLALTLAACSDSAPPAAFNAPPSASLRVSNPPPSPTVAADVRVYVTGAVARPGVYGLRPDSRVEDAIAAAGGFVDGADMPRVNLAARVRDEEEIFVPRLGEAVPNLSSKSINVNTATAAQLRDALGIPSALASRIVAYRRQHGPFHSVDDLRQVPVPDDQLARIRSQLSAS